MLCLHVYLNVNMSRSHLNNHYVIFHINLRNSTKKLGNIAQFPIHETITCKMQRISSEGEGRNTVLNRPGLSIPKCPWQGLITDTLGFSVGTLPNRNQAHGIPASEAIK
jgi:hypothetical protein